MVKTIGLATGPAYIPKLKLLSQIYYVHTITTRIFHENCMKMSVKMFLYICLAHKPLSTLTMKSSYLIASKHSSYCQ